MLSLVRIAITPHADQVNWPSLPSMSMIWSYVHVHMWMSETQDATKVIPEVMPAGNMGACVTCVEITLRDLKGSGLQAF